jgi:hypothetical protein
MLIHLIYIAVYILIFSKLFLMYHCDLIVAESSQKVRRKFVENAPLPSCSSL